MPIHVKLDQMVIHGEQGPKGDKGEQGEPGPSGSIIDANHCDLQGLDYPTSMHTGFQQELTWDNDLKTCLCPLSHP